MSRYPTDEKHWELQRIQREQGAYRMWPVHEPVALFNADRHATAARLILVSLSQHYFECLASGRLEAWHKAASSAVELLASVPDVKFERRVSPSA